MSRLLKNRIRERINMKIKSPSLQRVVTYFLVVLYTVKTRVNILINHKVISRLAFSEADKYLTDYYPNKCKTTQFTEYQEVTRSLNLSIIIPVYNAMDYLEECLDSVLKQKNYSCYEVIAINDGSTDKSLDILKQYQQRYKQLVVVDQPNHGISATRNRGIKMSKGQYITFLDADDQLDFSVLPALIKNMQNEKIQMLQASYQTVYQGRVVKKTDFLANQSLSEATDGYPWAKIYDYRLWERVRFPENLYFEDTVLLFLIGPQVKRFLASDTQLIKYRVNENGFIQSNKNTPVNIDSLYIVDWIFKQQKELSIPMTDELIQLYLFQLSNMLVRRISGLNNALQEAVFIEARELVLQLPINGKASTITKLERQIIEAFKTRRFKTWLQLSQLY